MSKEPIDIVSEEDKAEAARLKAVAAMNAVHAPTPGRHYSPNKPDQTPTPEEASKKEQSPPVVTEPGATEQPQEAPKKITRPKLKKS